MVQHTLSISCDWGNSIKIILPQNFTILNTGATTPLVSQGQYQVIRGQEQNTTCLVLGFSEDVHISQSESCLNIEYFHSSYKRFYEHLNFCHKSNSSISSYLSKKLHMSLYYLQHVGCDLIQVLDAADIQCQQ